MTWVIHFWQKYHTSDVVFFSVYVIKRYVMLICTIAGDVNFGHLV